MHLLKSSNEWSVDFVLGIIWKIDCRDPCPSPPWPWHCDLILNRVLYHDLDNDYDELRSIPWYFFNYCPETNCEWTDRQTNEWTDGQPLIPSPPTSLRRETKMSQLTLVVNPEHRRDATCCLILSVPGSSCPGVDHLTKVLGDDGIGWNVHNA